MSGSVMGGGAAHGREPILQRMANRIFRCSHRHKSHALTPRGETERYAVCLDCGARLDPGQPALPVDGGSRTGRRAALRLGVAAVSVAGASVYWAARAPGPAGGAISTPVLSSRLAASPAGIIAPGRAAAAIPAASAALDSAAAKLVEGISPAAAPPRASRPVPHLESKGSIVVLGRDAASALELSRHPTTLTALIQNGSLFAVSRGIAVRICQRKDGISQVRIMEGSRRGQEGWGPTGQIALP